MQVAVFLHVEIDKFGYATPVGPHVRVLHRLSIQGAQAVLDGCDRMLKSYEVDLTKN